MGERIIAALIAAIVAFVIAAGGWFWTWKQAEQSRKKLAALEHLEHQIGELYGPLLGLIMHSRIVSEVKKKLLLPGTPDGETGNFRDEQDVEVARFFERNYSFIINREIRNLIGSKMHLLDSMKLPPIFEEFLQHAAEYECLHDLWREKGVEADKNYKGVKVTRKRWPNDLESEVRKKLNQLRADHQRFLADVAAMNKKMP
jgi:hypothetical protein